MAEPITNVLGIVGMENKGAYDANAYYEKLNVVSYQGSSYCALNSVHNVLPTDTTKWQLIAEKGDKGDTGAAGYTPVKGTDYYTASDKAALETDLSHDVTNEVSSQLSTLTSATPLVATSTAGMTDTTRIYVNTTDGHWYWYDGTDWQDGGTYQSTGISDNSIDIYNLNSELQDNFIIEFSNDIDLGTAIQNKFVQVIDNKADIADSNSLKYYKYQLSTNEIYVFSGYNFGNACGLLVCDDEDNVIYNSNPNKQTGYTSLMFKTNNEVLYAYVSKRTAGTGYETIGNSCRLRNVIKVVNKYNFDITTQLLETLQGYVLNSAIGNYISISASPDMTSKIYSMEKGKKYKLKGINYFSVAGRILTKDYKTIYNTNTDSARVITPYEYEFIAEQDGYIILTDYLTNISTLEVINQYHDEIKDEIIVDIENDLKLKNPLYNKKWTVIGDSLSAESTLAPEKSYVNYISENNNMDVTNLAVGGSGYMRSDNNFVVQSGQVTNDADIVTVFGSWNDFPDMYNAIGQLGDTGTDTLYGCVYNTLNNIITNAPNSKIGVILPTPWGSYSYFNATSYTWSTKIPQYLNAIKDTCKIFGIPVLDLYYNSELKPWISSFQQEYYKDNGDTVHPNTLGHKKYIVPLIENFMKNIL